VTPDPLSSTNIRTGKITSTNSAKSKMGVYYGERELGRSDDEIAFAKVDLIVPPGPGTNGGTPLPEDRLTNGGTAPATNELNPGTFVLLYGEDQTNRVATTLTLKADPTGGSVTLDQHGLTDLKIYSDAALQEELTLPKTWTNGETSPTTLYMVGSSTSTNLQSSQGTLDLTYKANLAADGGEYSIKDTVGVTLLPVDIDVVHPASGELAESKEDKDDGGYVSIRRMFDNQDLAPVTKLVIRAISGAQSGWKTRLKFTPSDRYKIYKNTARTEEVSSEQAEFDATQDATLYFQGLKKSQSRGGEEIKMQVGINGQWSDGDSVKCTIVQSEFQIQVKAFIPYAWTDPESGWQTALVMGGKVAKGDNRGFVNAYSDRTHGYAAASFRVMQKVTLTPYEELHGTPDLQNERLAEPGIISEHYEKANSVDPSELHLTYGSLSPTGTPVSGTPEIKDEDYRNSTRASKSSSITIEAGGIDGALPWYARATGNRIDWVLTFSIDVSADPLLPKVSFSGWHDRYPAYEIIVIESNGDFKDIHRHPPASGDHPGQTSLDDANAVTVGRPDTISN
jgi:hypothetical protein